MQLTAQLPFGILCILFSHCAQVTAVCSTLPCVQNVPVYGIDPNPLFSGVPSSTQAEEPPAKETPASSTTPPAFNPPAVPAKPYKAPAAISSTSSASTPIPSPTTTSSATPTSSPSPVPPPATSSTPSAEPTVISSQRSSTGVPTVTPSTEPTGISISGSSTGIPTVTPPSLTAVSSNSTSPVTQSATALSITSARSNSSASITKPASITQCSGCRVLANQVQVYYWPTASVKHDCARGASVSPFETGVPYASNASRISSLAPQVADSPATTVVDGHTFSFPSLYVSVIGGISVSDSCGIKGSAHTNPAPVAVQAITTASYSSWPSTCRPQGQNADAVIDTLALSDIACPTWGLSDPFTTSCDGSTYLTETYGPPYNPVILVPTELMSIDPAWGACTTDPAAALLTLPCGIYDPPKALKTAPALVPGGDPSDSSSLDATPEHRPAQALKQAGALAPAVTPANDPPAPTTPAAAPANVGSPSLPKPTTAASNSGNDPSENTSQNKASDPASDLLKLDHVDPGTKQSDGKTQNTPDQQGDSAPASDPQKSDANDPGTESSGDSGQSGSGQKQQLAPASDPQTPDSNDPGTGSSQSGSNQGGSGQKQPPAPVSDPQKSDPKPQPAVPQAPTTINLGGGAPSSQGVAAFINGALGGSAPFLAPAAPPAFTPHAVTALGQTLSITDPSAVAIGGSTLSVGGPAHISNGNYYSLAPSGSLIAGTLPPTPGPSSPPVLSVAGSTYTANAASQFIVAGQTLTPGEQIIVASTPISLHPSGNVAIVGGSTQVLATPAPSPSPAVMTFAGSTYTADAASQFVVAGQTLTPGGQIDVANTPILLNPSAEVAVVGGSTQVLATPAPSSNAAVMTVGGSTYTANAASQFVVAGQTLTPGGQITVSNTPISLAPSANVAVIGTSTQLLTTPAPTSNAAIMTFAGSTYTANTASQFVIVGQTLTPGGIITASGTTISMPTGANVAVIGSSTQTFATASALLTAEAPVMTWDGSTYTADASSDFIIGSKTLTPGGIITVLGTPISFAQGAADVVIGTSTQSLSSAVITPADIFTVGGQIITANPTGFAIAGTTLLPGGKGVTVSGTSVSLAPGGTLVVGNTSTVLPTQGSATGPAVFEGAQGKLATPKMAWLVAYTTFWTALGAFFLLW